MPEKRLDLYAQMEVRPWSSRFAATAASRAACEVSQHSFNESL
jgi:hypothetical protein